MTAQQIDRRQLKEEARDLLSTAQVSPKGMTALYFGLVILLSAGDTLVGGDAVNLTDRNLLGIFVYVMVALVNALLSAGYTGYCMAIRRGERAEYLSLFDGFSLAGKVIVLQLLQTVFIFLWSLLFVIPGVIATYRYRFALYNLLEDPNIGALEALDMSKRQTRGYKGQVFLLDLSYLGWSILASLPALIWSMQIYGQEIGILLNGAAPQSIMPELGIPLLALSLGFDLWNLVVSLFYLPNFQCVELGYFDIAKSTSGVGLGPGPDTADQGPDGLGGW